MKRFAYLLLFLLVVCNAKILAQPELDAGFNVTGKLVLSGFLAGVSDIAVQPDNKIVFTGKCYTIDGPYNVCLGRMNENGTADTTFGGPRQGFVLTRISGASASDGWRSDGLAIQPDGKIVVVGSSSFSAFTTDIILARYNSNGTLDTTFGNNGIVRTDANQNYTGKKVVVQNDGKIVLVGYNKLSDSAYMQLIRRYNSNGTVDEAFANNGSLQVTIPGSYTSGTDIALQPDGKILTAGASWTIEGTPNPSASSIIVRLNQNGSYDTTFDEDGIKAVPLGTSASFASGFNSIAVQSDGRIVGLSTLKKLHRFNQDGSVDTSFASNGSVDILNAATTLANDVVVSPSGRITVTGEKAYCNCQVPYPYHISRYLPNGSPDTSFSGDGFLDIDISSTTSDFARASAYDSNGRVILGGSSATGTVLSPYENGTWSFARLAALPAQNVGFTGRVTETNGKGVINAYLTLKNGSTVVGFARTNPFGYFHFANVPSNVTYTLSTVSKGLNFFDRSVLVDGAIENYLVVSQ